jgi:hypothetical protein
VIITQKITVADTVIQFFMFYLFVSVLSSIDNIVLWCNAIHFDTDAYADTDPDWENAPTTKI